MKKLIVFIFVASFLAMPSSAEPANIHHVDYKQAVRIGRKSFNKKSVGMIIREILNRKRIERMEIELYELPNTIPIPLYDSLDHDRLKNLA